MVADVMEEPRREVPEIVGNQRCSLCPKLEHTACIGCHSLFCRTHAISALSWTPIGRGPATVSLVLCEECLPTTIAILEKARARLQLIAQYEL